MDGPLSITGNQLPQLREFGDAAAIRSRIYGNVLDSASRIEPVSNTRHTLRLTAPTYDGPEEYSLEDQKKAILSGQTLTRKLRGTWELLDNATGQVLDQKKTTVANVPYITPRGTFIYRGSEYTLAHQLRLRPGVFARERENGELEAHVNILPGKGLSHRIFLEPETGVFKLRMGQANVPLLPLLKALGTPEKALAEAWGPELLAANKQKDDTVSIGKLYRRLLRDKPAGEGGQAAALAELIRSWPLDKDVTRRTLGAEHANLSPEAYLDITKKLLAIRRKEAEPDDRDHLAFQQVYGPEDLLAERLLKVKAPLRKLLFKASLRNSVKNIPPGMLDAAMHSALLGSGLGQPTESINPLQIFEQQVRVSRMGEGGIPSLSSIPEEARNVQPSHFGYIDGLVTPESLRAGVDLRFARGARKGEDGRVYTQLRNVRTGQPEYKAPQDIAESVIAFPGELASKRPLVQAMVRGQLRSVPRNKVDFELPHMEDAFSIGSNLVPFKSASKGQRAMMAERMLTQALPVVDAEAPLVQAGMPGTTDRSYEEEYGNVLGALRADKGGQVIGVAPGKLSVRYDDGTTKDIELYNHFALNRKTGIHQTPVVEVGQRFQPGELLVRSNYTDKNGATALGKNARVAYIPFKGLNFEDAIVISESFAKRSASDHYYQHVLENSDDHVIGRKEYISLFPSKFKRAQLDNFDDSGLIKPGTEVKFGDPLVLAARKRERSHNSLHRGRSPSFADAAEVWNHHSPGVVTDVHRGPEGVNVIVKSTAETKVGDKLCFDPLTSVRTRQGWKPVAAITVDDEVATLNPATDELEWQKPTHVWTYEHDGPMYFLNTRQINMLVTLDHRLWAAPRGKSFQAITAQDLYASDGRWTFKKDCKWKGVDQEIMDLESTYGTMARRDCRQQVLYRVRMDDWLEFLGYYMAEGWCSYESSGQFAVKIGQYYKSDAWDAIANCLDRLGLRFRYDNQAGRFVVNSKWLYAVLSRYGDSLRKYVPEYVQELCPRQLRIFFDAYMAGDGHTGAHLEYGSSSQRLAEDMQLICMKLGWSVHLKKLVRTDNWQKHPHWRGRVNRRQLRPTWQKTRMQQYASVCEAIVPYTGKVYCVTVPNHILYVQRDEKTYWSMNSGRYGDKSVIAAIVPDNEMPHDAQGRPFELAMNPLGIISRANTSQVIETVLGKIAEKTGKPYKVRDFEDIGDLVEFAQRELDKHGLSDEEDIFDPGTNRKIKGVLTGNRFIMKLHHTAESKGQGRGIADYTAEGTPARGGEEGSKRLALMDVNALLSSGATEVIRDASIVRGQQNPMYWQQYMSGHTPPVPEVPEVYKKFVEQFKAAGINVVRDGTRLNIMAMTGKDVDTLAEGRDLENAETVHWRDGLKPATGGLFDPALTGGHGGNRWSAIKLHEPMLNPVMEEPARRLLNLTEDKFRSILAGRESLNGFRGPKAIHQALSNVDLDREIAAARVVLREGKRTARDAASRKLGYLKAAKRLNIHPRDWMLERVPVLPPKFRPVSVMQASKRPMVADPNFLYKDLFDSNANLKSLADDVDDLGDERLAVYDAMKAVTGLGEPIQQRTRDRRVKGLLSQIFGSSPKYGTVQQKLIGSAVDIVGRAVITPNPDLDMDQVGLPENAAWNVYRPFVVRRLVRSGMGKLDAVRAVVEKQPAARTALLQELGARPVIIDRAPVLHRYGVMAFWPQLTKGDTLQVPPLIVKGFGADFDGDQMNYHVPVTDEAVEDAVQKLLPSRNLLSTQTFKVHQLPANEYVGGLYSASTKRDNKKRARTFADAAAALAAYRRGEIDADQPVETVG